MAEVIVKRKHPYRGTRPKGKLPTLEDTKAIGPIEQMPPRDRMQMVGRADGGRWAKGNCGNAGSGRTNNARKELGKNFCQALADDFEEHGAAAIKLCRLTDPATYVRVCASLLPKEVTVSDERQMSDEQLHAALKHMFDEKMISSLFGESARVVSSDGKTIEGDALSAKPSDPAKMN
jgi:hypothetical protein